MTTEQKLSAVIHAQVKGGYCKWKPYPIKRLKFSRVICILLDPGGLKAAYGTRPTLNNIQIGPTLLTDEWEVAAAIILAAWLSGGAEGAIDTAYSLLKND